jgi:hypothetical protein
MATANLKMHFQYWILPTIAMLIFICVFYFNPFGLSKFLAPESNREFGIVENLQLLLLAAIFIYCIKGIRKRETKIEKYTYGLVAGATFFIFLEETDYGLHFYDYFSGKKNNDPTEFVFFDEKVRNVHNYGKVNLNIFKFLSYLVIVVFFVILPLIPSRIKERSAILKYLSPSRFIVATSLSLLILNQVALYVSKAYVHTNLALEHNVSEFEEIMTYYIIFLYIQEMVNKPASITPFRN